MLKSLRPYAKPFHMLERGTDFSVEGRFQDTLAYNHFNQKDVENLAVLREIFSQAIDEAISLMTAYFDEIKSPGSEGMAKEEVASYIHTYLNKPRNKEYVDEIIAFFNLLRQRQYHLGKIMVAFNQLHFYFTTYLLSKKGLNPNRCFELLKTMQFANNIDQQVLVEVYTEKLMESAADGISTLLEKNAEIMFIKDLLQRLDDQNHHVQNVTTASEELSASIDEIAKGSVMVAEQTEDSVQKVAEGKRIIETALDEIIKTEQNFDSIVSRFKQLQEYVSGIEDIVKIINQIADQTNLLALNASIEAARAGEEGRGFAVVANEVRKLANTTVESVKTVSDNVMQLRSLSNGVSDSIHSTSDVIKRGVDEAKQAFPILSDIIGQVKTIHDATNHMAAVTEEQSSAVDDVSNRMANVAELSEDVRQLGQKTGIAVYELSKCTDSFRNMLFSNPVKLSTRAILQLAKSDHILWKWRIYSMLMGYERVSADQVSSHDLCRLGKWYFDKDTADRLGHLSSFQQLDEPHQQVHGYAKRASQAFERGDINQAEHELQGIESASKKVIQLIDDILGQI